MGGGRSSSQAEGLGGRGEAGRSPTPGSVSLRSGHPQGCSGHPLQSPAPTSLEGLQGRLSADTPGTLREGCSCTAAPVCKALSSPALSHEPPTSQPRL